MVSGFRLVESIRYSLSDMKNRNLGVISKWIGTRQRVVRQGV